MTMKCSIAQQALISMSNMLGIDVCIKHVSSGLFKRVYISKNDDMYTWNYDYCIGHILGRTVYMDIDFFSLKTRDAHDFAMEHTYFGERCKIPFSWSNVQYSDYESLLMLECFLASRSFEIDCKENKRRVCIGNPFYKKNELIDCSTEEELNVKIDLLGIYDMHDKNIVDVSKMLTV